jgi:hypothetical protein
MTPQQQAQFEAIAIYDPEAAQRYRLLISDADYFVKYRQQTPKILSDSELNEIAQVEVAA